MDANKKEKNLEIFSISSQIPENKIIDSKRKWWHIDKEMVRFKLHFFLFIGGFGTVCPYLTVFAKNRIGISAAGLAAIITTDQFLFIFTKPLMGYLADYFQKLKVIICILTIVPIIFLFLLLPIPQIRVEHEENSHQKVFMPILNIKSVHQNESCKLENKTQLSANNYSNFFCAFGTDKPPKTDDKCLEVSLTKPIENNSTIISNLDNYSSICSTCCNTTETCYVFSCPNIPNSSMEPSAEVSQFRTYQFWTFASAFTIGIAAVNALFTLSDTACCESIAKTGADFGRQRLYGAIGWGTMAPLGGLLHDYTGDYLVSFIIMAIMLILSVCNVWKIDLVQPQFSQNIMKDVGKVLSSTEFLAFEFGVLMNGIGCGILWFYQIWFLTTIGASAFLCGLVQTVQCFAGEIPFMFYSGWFIKKLGHFNVLTLALAAYSVRFFFYSYLHNPWLTLPMEVVHGVTYGIFYAAVASYAKLSAKPGTEATTQCLLFSTHEGLGCGIGCIIAGLGFDTIGGHQTFFYACIFSACGMLLNLTFTFWNRRQKKSISVTPPNTK